ncbi:MAG TPA: septation protein A [Rhizomicrobium sp.]|nr:septation protein A [Rhizomicrobium sp.]
MSSGAKSPQSPLVKLALDLGPLIVFFASFQFFGIYGATAAFMVAILVALAIGYARERRLSPMPLFTAVLVVVFGGLTLYLKNDTFIKMKPTVLYAFVGMLLLGGLLFNRLFIKYVFAQAFDLSEEGWRKLTWRWGIFAFALAVLNEIVWRNFSTAIWVDFKVWAIMPLIFLFALAQTPLVLRHDNSPRKETGGPNT